MSGRIQVKLTPQDAQLLRLLAEHDCRDPWQMLVWLLRQEGYRRGLLEMPTPVPIPEDPYDDAYFEAMAIQEHRD